eukprot:381048-Prorocentrum_minimum.AAC.1
MVNYNYKRPPAGAASSSPGRASWPVSSAAPPARRPPPGRKLKHNSKLLCPFPSRASVGATTNRGGGAARPRSRSLDDYQGPGPYGTPVRPPVR